MEDFTTIARPYAKAAFEFAKECSQIKEWGTLLNYASFIVQDKQIFILIRNHRINQEQLLEVFCFVLKDLLNDPMRNFFRLVIFNKRVLVFPTIREIFGQLYDAYCQIKEVKVTSAYPLNEKEESQLMEALKKRFQSQVKLYCEVDKTILGGAIIRAGDWVLDGSGRGRLVRLKEYL